MSAAKGSDGKPLLYSDERSDAERFDPKRFRGSLDPSRVPGYSEIVRANDIDKADDLLFREQNNYTKEEAFEIVGAEPQPLPVEFQWLRVSGPGGADSSTAAREIDNKKNQEGFRLATSEDLERHGYGFPPTAREAEDGSIRRGPDVALFIRSGEVARMWKRHKAEEAARAEGAQLPESFTADGGYSSPTFSEEEREKADIVH